MIPDSVSDYRVNPWTGEAFPEYIESEYHTIRVHPQLGHASVRLLEQPFKKAGEIESTRISILGWDGLDYTIPYNVIDKSLEPNSKEYRVAFDPLGNAPRGLCGFNTSDLGLKIKVSYWGLGSTTSSEAYFGVLVGCMIPHFLNAGASTVEEMKNFGFMIADGKTPDQAGISNAKWQGPTPLMYEDMGGGVWEYRHLVSGPEADNGTIQQFKVAKHGHELTGTTGELISGEGELTDVFFERIRPNPSASANDYFDNAGFSGDVLSGELPFSEHDIHGLKIKSSLTTLDNKISDLSGQTLNPSTIAGGYNLSGRIENTPHPDQIICLMMLKVK